MIKNFDLSNYKVFSERFNSDNLISSDGKTMVKLFKTKTDDIIQSMTKELNITKKILSLGLKTPDCIDLVETKDGRVGLLYEYIANKKSLSRAVSEDYSLLEEYSSIFAEEIKKIHTTECDTSFFPNIEDEIRHGLEILPIEKENKEYLLKVMENTPKATTCLHGDCQMSNFIIADKKTYVIDLGFFCYGNPIYDLGLWTVFANDLIQKNCCKNMFHMDVEYGMKMYKKSMEVYFHTTDEAEIERLKNYLEPYGYLTLCFAMQTVVYKEAFIHMNEGIERCRKRGQNLTSSK